MGEKAVEQALRALRHRERSSSQIERYLEAHGIDEPDRAVALATLTRTGLVDDCRFAEARARVLAERGAGDALIEHDLDSAGVERATIEEVLGGLESESLRARRVVDRRGPDARTERYLLGKGFSPDVTHAAVAAARAERLR
jgi:regulatory protein